jgi:Domain of unknown function (DUF222)
MSAKAQLFVTMKLDDLTRRVGAGATVGALGAGTILAPETVRRFACDAGIVPVVLGSQGEILDLGRTVRWFTAAQAKALWLHEDVEVLGAQKSDPRFWGWASSTCPYVEAMIEGWAGDEPGGFRHGWLVGQATRLAAAKRLGCIADRDHQRALAALQDRFEILLTGGDRRSAAPGEFVGVVRWGEERVAAMSDKRARDELGGHDHPQPRPSAFCKGVPR